MKRLYIGVLWMVFSLSILQAKEIKMSSPDEKYQFTLSDEGGNLHYSLNWNAKETIKPSLLGIKANTIWRDHLSLGDMTTAEQDTVWHPVYGERSTIKDQYKAWSVVINRQNSRDKLVLNILYRKEQKLTLHPGLRLLMNFSHWKDGPVNQTVRCF